MIIINNIVFIPKFWLVSYALASFGLYFIWNENTSIILFAIVINLVIGAMMIRENMKQPNTLDELQKKIQMDAMGIALGVVQ